MTTMMIFSESLIELIVCHLSLAEGAGRCRTQNFSASQGQVLSPEAKVFVEKQKKEREGGREGSIKRRGDGGPSFAFGVQ